MATTTDVRTSDQILQQLRPTSRGKTSYTSMNEWLHMPGKTVPTAKPVFREFNEWKALPTHEMAKAAVDAQADREVPAVIPHPPSQTQDLYTRTYDNLTNQIAYRWPNPGSPRNREGGIGGTWRHIKEVLCHGGSRCMFVDGLVSVYDNQKFTDKLQAQLSSRPHIKPLYKPIKAGDNPTSPRTSFNAYAVLPDVPSASKAGSKSRVQYPGARHAYY